MPDLINLNKARKAKAKQSQAATGREESHPLRRLNQKRKSDAATNCRHDDKLDGHRLSTAQSSKTIDEQQ
ncbi:MAG: hypothetical protein WDN06_17740 [Asticcacaulis sp.]